MQLVHRRQKQAFELRIANRLFQHLREHIFQAAQITLAAVGDILQRAEFLCRQFGVGCADGGQYVLQVAAFGNGGNTFGGELLGEGHAHDSLLSDFGVSGCIVFSDGLFGGFEAV